MTRDEWKRLKAIVEEALAEPDDRRRAFVLERCGDNAELSAAALTLLASMADAEHLYEPPSFTRIRGAAAVASELDTRHPVVGTLIGPYRVIAEIGRGGMGAAYLASRADDLYEKQVAIKLIKRGMDTDAILTRFHHERQILARLQHPNIVTLFDGGTTADGLPYFIMEYVDGLPIDKYCDAHTLTIPDRLRLFQSVCGAVHHAHGHRVLHRDLKPSNILVTSSGIPKLLDFGIAKVLDADAAPDNAAPTIFGRALTPQFASPEQIRGEPLTAASDVYSLGVLLYVLTTGQQPYRLSGLAPHEAERTVCEEPPARPAAVIEDDASRARGERTTELQRRFARGLEAILLRALAKDPAERYQTPAALADDLGRYLNGQRPAAQSGWWTLTQTQRRLRGPMAWAAGVLLALAVAASAAWYWPSRPALQEARSIAVMPLVQSGGGPDLDYLSDGLAHDVMTRLSRIPRLRVIGRDSAARYRDSRLDAADVARALGVDAILTGHVTQAGNRLRVTAEVVDARDRRRLWGAQYDRTLGDIHYLQGELAQEIASSLHLQLSRDEQAHFSRASTENADAYQFYLKGRYFWNKRTAAGLRTSIDYLRQAIERDPGYALAYAGLADSYSLLTEYHSAPAFETYPEALAAVTRALELEPDLAEAHAARAYIHQFYEWNFEAAEREFRRAIQLNPAYATARQWYAEYLMAMGRHDESLAAIARAREIDPLSLIINAVEAYIHYIGRDYDRAIEQCEKVIEMDPNFPEVYEYLKRAYDQQGRFRDAITARQARRRILNRPSGDTPALRAAAAATSAQVYWQHRYQQEMEEAKDEGLRPFELAEILAQGGQTALALDWLERSCREPDFMTMIMRVAPTLDSLRQEPRYLALVARGCRI